MFANPAFKDHHPQLASELYRDDWPLPEFAPIYHECIERLGEFPNLQSITVHKDRHNSNSEPFQDHNFQGVWLQKILKPIKNRLNDIAVRNYHNIANDEDRIEGFL